MIDVKNTLVIIRGAGDLASGVALRLHNSGFPIIMLDIAEPTVIRRTVSFAEAVYEGRVKIEDAEAMLCETQDASEVLKLAKSGKIAVCVDPEGRLIEELRPEIVIDGILVKKNLGTSVKMAPFVVALGPGFIARRRETFVSEGAENPVSAGADADKGISESVFLDKSVNAASLSANAGDSSNANGLYVDAVIETQRGHRLGTIIYEGEAAKNTGIPGLIGGYGKERVMHSPCAGVFRGVSVIGDLVSAGDTVAYVDETPVKTEISGKVRGMLRTGLRVPAGFKVADVDPRGASTDHTTVSDKARSIGGGVLEAVMHFLTANCRDGRPFM